LQEVDVDQTIAENANANVVDITPENEDGQPDTDKEPEKVTDAEIVTPAKTTTPAVTEEDPGY